MSALGGNTVEQSIALAFILLGTGLFASWLGYYLYNRYQARHAGESKFRYDTAWQKADVVEERTRSVSRQSGIEVTGSGTGKAGVKLGRPASATPAAAKKTKYNKIEKTEMI
jgi:hypothetical protein